MGSIPPLGTNISIVISAHCWRAFWENRGCNRAGDTTGAAFRPRGSASRFMPPPSTEQLLARSSCGSVATLIAPRSGRIPPDAAAPHALLIATTRASARGRATRTMMACTAVSECCVHGRIASRPFPGHHLLCPLPRSSRRLHRPTSAEVARQPRRDARRTTNLQAGCITLTDLWKSHSGVEDTRLLMAGLFCMAWSDFHQEPLAFFS